MVRKYLILLIRFHFPHLINLGELNGTEDVHILIYLLPEGRISLKAAPWDSEDRQRFPHPGN